MKIDIETLRKTKGIGGKTLERIIEQHNIDNNIKAFKSEHMSSDKYKVDKDINLWQGDCLELMNHIPDKSVDMILADLPYGTTRNKWDSIIPLDSLWKQYKRIIANRGVIVLFGSEPFTTKLIDSNLPMFKYKIVWVKTVGSGQLNCNYAPLKLHEDITVFSRSAACYVKNKDRAMIYNPQFSEGEPYRIKRDIKSSDTYDYQRKHESVNDGFRYPTDVVHFSNPRVKGGHPTQKPVDLLEYLIKTYTDKGMIVLDNTMGSGSTGVACKNIGRRFIGIELDNEYFKIAEDRIKDIQ